MPRLRLLPLAEVAETPEQAAPILQYLMNRGGPIAIDTETTGLDIMRDRVLFWSMATESRRFFFPAELLFFFDPLFRRLDVSWYLANAKYDLHLLANHGIKLLGPVWDIIVMDAMVDDTRPHGLKEQAIHAYGARWGDFKELFLDPTFVADRLGLEKRSFTQFKRMSVGDRLLFVHDENPRLVVDYATCDAFFTYVRAEDLRKELAGIELPTEMVPGLNSLFDYFDIIEVPLTKSLWRMERRGFLVDFDRVKKIDGPMRDGIKAAEQNIAEVSGIRINPNSTDELRRVLFTDRGFGLKPVRYTAGDGKPKESTDEKALTLLQSRVRNDSPAYRFIDAVLKYRHIKKLHGTYVKNLHKTVGPDGRVHSRLNQAGARTSRLSSSDPNMQNIPARDDEFGIRSCFVSGPGMDLVDLDYPQIEFRIVAVLAGEEGMMADIRRGWDIHSANAAAMFPDVEYEALMAAIAKKDARQPLEDGEKTLIKRRGVAKTVGLGTMYGEGGKKMAGQLNITADEAYGYIDQFFASKPGIRNLIDYMHSFAHSYGFTYTMLGRMRQLHKINCGKRGLEAAEERQAFNTLVQGSGAEMMKLAILRADNDERLRELGAHLVLTVHDELISEAPSDTAKDVLEVKRELMADPFRWGPIDITYPVPIDPDGKIAHRWSDAK